MSDPDNKHELATIGSNSEINRDLIDQVVADHMALLGAEFDLKSLRLADDTAQLIARSRIREVVRIDTSALTIFERGIVLQHLLNIIFNSRDDHSCKPD